MSKKVLIAPNSFKECADSVHTAELFKKYLNHPGISLISAPVSDGGDGFLKVCTHSFNLELIDFTIISPFNTNLNVQVGYNKKNKTVYIESADVLGLKIIPEEYRDPMKLSSSGMGVLLNRIFSSLSPDKIVIGIGGTGTNDLGIGMLSQLGIIFIDSSGESVIPTPENIHSIMDVKRERIPDLLVELIIDVNNPLLGPEGATLIYGPQKGLKEKELINLEEQFARLISIFQNKKILSPNKFLSGAGGGLAAAFQIFFNTATKTSSEFILNDLNLKTHIRNSDIIITGEGEFDEQSARGKAVSVLIENSLRPVYLVCGLIKTPPINHKNVSAISLLNFFSTKGDSIKNFESGIEKACSQILSQEKF